jgi:hypothetical protein
MSNPTMTTSNQNGGLRQKNIRLAWILAGFALFIFATSFPFWMNIFTIAGDLSR